MSELSVKMPSPKAVEEEDNPSDKHLEASVIKSEEIFDLKHGETLDSTKAEKKDKDIPTSDYSKCSEDNEMIDNTVVDVNINKEVIKSEIMPTIQTEHKNTMITDENSTIPDQIVAKNNDIDTPAKYAKYCTEFEIENESVVDKVGDVDHDKKVATPVIESEKTFDLKKYENPAKSTEINSQNDKPNNDSHNIKTSDYSKCSQDIEMIDNTVVDVNISNEVNKSEAMPTIEAEQKNTMITDETLAIPDQIVANNNHTDTPATDAKYSTEFEIENESVVDKVGDVDYDKNVAMPVIELEKTFDLKNDENPAKSTEINSQNDKPNNDSHNIQTSDYSEFPQDIEMLDNTVVDVNISNEVNKSEVMPTIEAEQKNTMITDETLAIPDQIVANNNHTDAKYSTEFEIENESVVDKVGDVDYDKNVATPVIESEKTFDLKNDENPAKSTEINPQNDKPNNDSHNIQTSDYSEFSQDIEMLANTVVDGNISYEVNKSEVMPTIEAEQKNTMITDETLAIPDQIVANNNHTDTSATDAKYSVEFEMENESVVDKVGDVDYDKNFATPVIESEKTFDLKNDENPAKSTEINSQNDKPNNDSHNIQTSDYSEFSQDIEMLANTVVDGNISNEVNKSEVMPTIEAEQKNTMITDETLAIPDEIVANNNHTDTSATDAKYSTKFEIENESVVDKVGDVDYDKNVATPVIESEKTVNLKNDENPAKSTEINSQNDKTNNDYSKSPEDVEMEYKIAVDKNKDVSLENNGKISTIDNEQNSIITDENLAIPHQVVKQSSGDIDDILTRTDHNSQIEKGDTEIQDEYDMQSASSEIDRDESCIDYSPALFNVSRTVRIKGVPLNIDRKYGRHIVNIKNILSQHMIGLTYVKASPGLPCLLSFDSFEHSEIALAYLKTKPNIFEEGPITDAEYATDEPDRVEIIKPGSAAASVMESDAIRVIDHYNAPKVIVLEHIPLSVPPRLINDIIRKCTNFRGEFLAMRPNVKDTTCKLYFHKLQDYHRLIGLLKRSNFPFRCETLKQQVHFLKVYGFPIFWNTNEVTQYIKTECKYNFPFSLTKPNPDKSEIIMTSLTIIEAENLRQKLKSLCIDGKNVRAYIIVDNSESIDQKIKRSYSVYTSKDEETVQPAVKKRRLEENSNTTTITEIPSTSDAPQPFNPFKNVKPVEMESVEMVDETFGLSLQYLAQIGVTLPLINKIYVRNINNLVTQDHEPDLRKVFSLAGHVREIIVKKTYHDYVGKTFTHLSIEYNHPVEAVQAVAMFHKQKLLGCAMIVQLEKKKLSVHLPPGLESIGKGFGPEGRPLPTIAQYVTLQPLKIALQSIGVQVKSEFNNCKFFDQSAIKTNIQTKQPTLQHKNQKTNYIKHQTNVRNNSNHPNFSPSAEATTSQVQSDPSAAMQAQFINMVQNIKNMVQTIPKLQNNQTTGQIAPQPTLAQQNLNEAAGQENFAEDFRTTSFSTPNLVQYPIPQLYLKQSQSLIKSDQPYYAQSRPSSQPPQPSGTPPPKTPKSYKPVSNNDYDKKSESKTSERSNHSRSQTNDYDKKSERKTNEWSNHYRPQNNDKKSDRKTSEESSYSRSQNKDKQSEGKISTEARSLKHKEFLALKYPDLVAFTNLPPSVTTEALSMKMREVGDIVLCKTADRGRALVRFKREQDAQRCIKLFNGSKVDGQVIRVKNL